MTPAQNDTRVIYHLFQLRNRKVPPVGLGLHFPFKWRKFTKKVVVSIQQTQDKNATSGNLVIFLLDDKRTLALRIVTLNVV